MLAQQRHKLIVIIDPPMVFFLTSDISDHPRCIRGAHGECAIARLPREPAVLGPFLMDPARGIRFHHPDAIGDVSISGQFYKYVHVIRGAPDRHGRAAFLAYDASQVRVQVGADLGHNAGLAVLRRPDDVGEQFAVRVRHVLTPATRAVDLRDRYPGLAPWATFFPPATQARPLRPSRGEGSAQDDSPEGSPPIR